MAQNVDPRTRQEVTKTGDEKPVIPKGHSVSKRDASDLVKERQRLQQELMTLMMSADKSVSAFPDGDNLLSWTATIQGPKDTVFEGLHYKLTFTFPDSYPYVAPTVRFTSTCFHPNVDTQGNICLDILKEKWSALYDVRTILISLQSLLGEPNNASPLNSYAASLWAEPAKYRKVLHEQYHPQNPKQS